MTTEQQQLQIKCLDTHGAFTLLEVILSLAIISLLALSVNQMIQSSFDVRDALADNSESTHRVSMVMQRLVNDLQHAYIISEKDFARFGESGKRQMKSIFKLEHQSGSGDYLAFTTMANRPLIKNRKETDTVFVIYKIVDSDDRNASGAKNLVRGQTPFVPTTFRETSLDYIKFETVARDVRDFSVQIWDGEKWSKDDWDSSRGIWRNLMPHLVKVSLDVGAGNVENTQTIKDDTDVLHLDTVVYLINAREFKELKSVSSNLRWDQL